MEKYKKFTDAGTGINPFVPYIPKYTQSSIIYTIGSLLRMILLSPILFLIKFIVLMCMFVAYTIMSTVFSMVRLFIIEKEIFVVFQVFLMETTTYIFILFYLLCFLDRYPFGS